MTDTTNARMAALAAAEPLNAYADHAEALVSTLHAMCALHEMHPIIDQTPMPALSQAFAKSLDEAAAELALLPPRLRDEAEAIRATARRDPLDELPGAWRGWLCIGLGFEAEIQGGGCFALRKTCASGWSILLTCAGGGGMPDADSWHVGVYPPGDDAEAVWQEQHDARHGPTAPMTFRQAVNAAFAIAESGEAAPEEENAAAMVADGLVLLDCVADAVLIDAASGYFTTEGGGRYRFDVSPAGGMEG